MADTERQMLTQMLSWVCGQLEYNNQLDLLNAPIRAWWEELKTLCDSALRTNLLVMVQRHAASGSETPLDPGECARVLIHQINNPHYGVRVVDISHFEVNRIHELAEEVIGANAPDQAPRLQTEIIPIYTCMECEGKTKDASRLDDPSWHHHTCSKARGKNNG